MKVVIIGGVAGGASAAARLRRLDESAEIVILERSGYVSYANCGLPYYVGGVIADRAKLTLQTPESFRTRFAIDVRVRHEAVAIDRAAQTVTVRALDEGSTYTESYDRLILSPGAHATIPNLPGVDSSRLFTLRTVEDTFAIYDAIEQTCARSATVVGAGFIGLEMAENLRERGLDVVLVQRDDHVLPILDADMAALAHNTLRAHGIDLRLNTHVTGFEEKEAGIATHLDGQPDIPSDLVILSIGVTPESGLAKAAGLELGLRGSIRVDSRMRTSDPRIYAVGDAVEVTHAVTGHLALIALAGPANKQGRIAADNICGIERRFTGSQGSSVLKLFDRTIAATGLTTNAAIAEGIDVDSVVLTPANHATYYPGSESIMLKVLFERATSRIVGAQAIGGDGVDKRIDVLAVAIRARMDANDLAELDLAYAPPYSSAKDPVNMAGFMIQNITEGRVRHLDWKSALADTEALLLDVRTAGERQRGAIEGSAHVPLDELRERLDEIPRERRVNVFCQSGLRSYLACRILVQHGFDAANVDGGFGFYEQTALDRSVQTREVGGCGMPA